MKNALILLTSALRLGSSHTADAVITAWPEPTVLTRETRLKLDIQALEYARTLRDQEKYTQAFCAYETLCKHTIDPEIEIQALQDMLEMREAGVDPKKLALEERKVLEHTLKIADQLREKKEYTAAAALYKELHNVPAPHFWMQGCAGSRLEAMRKAGQIQ